MCSIVHGIPVNEVKGIRWEALLNAAMLLQLASVDVFQDHCFQVSGDFDIPNPAALSFLVYVLGASG